MFTRIINILQKVSTKDIIEKPVNSLNQRQTLDEIITICENHRGFQNAQKSHDKTYLDKLILRYDDLTNSPKQELKGIF